MARGEVLADGWSAVMPKAPTPVRRTGAASVVPWIAVAMLVPAVVMVVSGGGSRAEGRRAELLSANGRQITAGVWPDAAAWPDTSAAGLVQPISSSSKHAALSNAGMSQLAEKPETEPGKTWALTPNDKVALTMYMESECPACRKFSTTVLKEILEAPGVGDIVDFRAVPWGWGRVIEAPTEQQVKADPLAFNILNRTAQLLPILARLGADGAQTPPIHFACQHGEGECAGNAIESCLQDIAPEHQKFFPVMDCIESRTCAEGMKPPLCVGQPTEVVNGCLQEFGSGLSMKEMNVCYSGPRVKELMLMNDMETLKAKPQWVPWFQIDGSNLVEVPETGGNSSALFRQQFLMGKRICDLYVAKTGKDAPKGCSSFPQSDADLGQDPFSRFAVANFTFLIAQLDMEREQQEHATALKKAAGISAATKKAPNHTAKSGHEVSPVAVAGVAKPALAEKIKMVKTWADHYFGHDAAHEALTKKLIANAQKPITSDSKELDKTSTGAKTNKDATNSLNVIKGESDAAARAWKPP